MARSQPSHMPPPVTDEAGGQLGERLRQLRKEAGFTLQDLARRSGVSLSTLSKIENAQVAPTFDTLLKAARGLGIGFEALLAPAAAEPAAAPRRTGGRLVVTRRQDAVGFSTPAYEYHVHANGLRRKSMTPLIMEVKARSLAEATTWSSHEGEEFILVLAGTVEMHTEFYEPMRLSAGDSAYIDSAMPHLFLNVGEGDARMASICYADGGGGAGPLANMPMPESADT